MMIPQFVSIALMLVTVATVQGVDWCTIDCPGMFPGMPSTKHTMCIYPEAGGPACSKYRRGFTEEEKRLILDFHNEKRSNVANGLETRGIGGPQPTASDMMEMEWDDEVETIAQRWADQCRERSHDECRMGSDGVDAGQNFAGVPMTGPMRLNRISVIKMLLNGWYDEVKNLVTSDVDSVFASSKGMTGHYTQMVWATSSSIGCGISHLETGGTHLRLICNYKPVGNYQLEPIYKRGPPASDCPPGTSPSTKYTGLCASQSSGDLQGPPSPPQLQTPTPPATQEAPSPVPPPAVPQSPPTSTPTQIHPAKEEKKPSLLSTIVTLPWRFLKWLFSIPIRIYELITKKLLS